MVEFVRYPELMEFLEEEFGQSLQSAAYYTNNEATIMHLRSDVEERFSRDDYREIAKEVIMDVRDAREKEDLYRTGETNCIIRVFDHAVVYLIPVSENLGIFLSIDPEASIPTPIRSFIDEVMRLIEKDRPD